MIRNSERSKARMFDVEGRSLQPPQSLQQLQNVALIDNDYEMIDSHIDESLRKRILSFEYVDFNTLLVKKYAR